MFKTHARVTGPIVMIGYGSIGSGTLPLIRRHIDHDPSRLVIIDPRPEIERQVRGLGARFINEAVTEANHESLLTPLLTQGEGQGFCVNLSVDTGSIDIMRLCRKLGVLYIDTVNEPWPGFYFGQGMTSAQRTNYALRERLLDERRRSPGGTTAVSCCGANPGMVSWFVKQALLDIKASTSTPGDEPTTREGWASLAQALGIKGIHIAERDTQVTRRRKSPDEFVNTWSVEGFVSEGCQPAELGWGTHERWMPADARHHHDGCGAAIYMERPGAATRVRSWTPTSQAQHALLVTHNESISISDHLTVREGDRVAYRPTCHYAYHPCDDAMLSLDEMFGRNRAQSKHRILSEDEITGGVDELGVLLFGHAKNAYWYGSRLSMAATRDLAPKQNATGLQVTSAVLAGMVWALENPNAGIVEADEMDWRRCLEVQVPYLGEVFGEYTDWTPLQGRPWMFDEDLDTEDPWQFRNILVR